jgi:hypothetical protein
MTQTIILPEQQIVSKIYLIRGQRVMVDTDLAEIYGVAKKRVREQVKRNIERFPKDFMFELNRQEFLNLNLYSIYDKNRNHLDLQKNTNLVTHFASSSLQNTENHQSKHLRSQNATSNVQDVDIDNKNKKNLVKKKKNRTFAGNCRKVLYKND